MAVLTESHDMQFDKKSLCKSVMKSFKSNFDSKSDRKKAFANAVEKLLGDEKIITEEDTLQIAPVKVEKVHKDKKSKKRKAEDETDEVAEKSKSAKTVESESTTASTAAVETVEPKVYPIPTGNTTILLFYAYCTPQMTRGMNTISPTAQLNNHYFNHNSTTPPFDLSSR